MIQDRDPLWQQPCPLPLASQPLDDQNLAPREDGIPAAPASRGKERLPSEAVPVFPDDDYQWMALL